MKVIETIAEWEKIRKPFSKEACGFVPTMGNLHDGHASLLRRSKRENEITVLSIFVNPTQFNQRDDFLKYPKTKEEDVRLAETCGVDFVLFLSEKEMYRDGYAYRVHETEISHQLEGAHRPGHFEGVLTIVMKLLHIVQPNRLYLGEKDYQQLCLIQGMIDAFFMNIEVVWCETIRLASGLPESSRNARLNADQFRRAEEFSRIFHDKNLSLNEIETRLKEKNIRVDYVSEWKGRRFAAVWVDDVRLIDNFVVQL